MTDRIYLQGSPDVETSTWCRDRINDDDREYVAVEELDALKAECEALRKDAERYRWLRNHPLHQSQAEIDVRQFKFPRATWAQIAYDELDAAIDAAIKEAK